MKPMVCICFLLVLARNESPGPPQIVIEHLNSVKVVKNATNPNSHPSLNNTAGGQPTSSKQILQNASEAAYAPEEDQNSQNNRDKAANSIPDHLYPSSSASHVTVASIMTGIVGGVATAGLIGGAVKVVKKRKENREIKDQIQRQYQMTAPFLGNKTINQSLNHWDQIDAKRGLKEQNKNKQEVSSVKSNNLKEKIKKHKKQHRHKKDNQNNIQHLLYKQISNSLLNQYFGRKQCGWKLCQQIVQKKNKKNKQLMMSCKKQEKKIYTKGKLQVKHILIKMIEIMKKTDQNWLNQISNNSIKKKQQQLLHKYLSQKNHPQHSKHYHQLHHFKVTQTRLIAQERAYLHSYAKSIDNKHKPYFLQRNHQTVQFLMTG